MSTLRWRSAAAAIVFGWVLATGPMASAETAPPYDFTGHWTGVPQEEGQPPLGLVADLATGTRPKTFTGTLVADDVPPVECAVRGRQKRNLKVKMRLTCEGGLVVKLRGTLVPDTETVAGTYTRPGRRVHRGTFALVRQAS